MKSLTTPSEALSWAFEHALSAQQPVAAANVARLRRAHPDMSPADVIKQLDRTYLATVTAAGVASGVASIGPATGLPVALLDLAFFTEASVLYVLSVADAHDLHPDDIERRRLLVMSVMLGDAASEAVTKAVGRTSQHWGKQIVQAIPMTAITKANKVLGPRFITKYGTKQGVLVLGKQVPLGIGAALGGTGNHLVGRGIVHTSRQMLGTAPSGWADDRIESFNPAFA